MDTYIRVPQVCAGRRVEDEEAEEGKEVLKSTLGADKGRTTAVRGAKADNAAHETFFSFIDMPE